MAMIAPAGAWGETCSQALASGEPGRRGITEYWHGYLSGFNLDHFRHVQEHLAAINLDGFVNGKRVDLANAEKLQEYCRAHGDATLAEAADATFEQLERELGAVDNHG